MNDLRIVFKNLIELAKDWRDFSKQKLGRVIAEYDSGSVRCYYSNTSGYSSVMFAIKKYGFSLDTVSVNSHNPVTIDGLKLRSINHIEDAIVKYSLLLAELKTEYNRLKEEAKQAEKQKRIEALKKEIKELGGADEELESEAKHDKQ